MKLTCPQCGSVNIRVDTRQGWCHEADCQHTGTRVDFKAPNQMAEHIQPPRAAWRDPVAMSMDGYDE